MSIFEPVMAMKMHPSDWSGRSHMTPPGCEFSVEERESQNENQDAVAKTGKRGGGKLRCLLVVPGVPWLMAASPQSLLSAGLLPPVCLPVSPLLTRTL